MTTEIKPTLSCLFLAPWTLPPLPDGASHWEIQPVPFKSTSLDFNAHDPPLPRAGCTAADRGQALWDVMTVMAGRRALGSIHADETRGGMDEILELRRLIGDVSEELRSDGDMYDPRILWFESDDVFLGHRRDFLVYDNWDVREILRKYGLTTYTDYNDHVKPFLIRSLTEIFPLGSPERAAIDEMYGEKSQ